MGAFAAGALCTALIAGAAFAIYVQFTGLRRDLARLEHDLAQYERARGRLYREAIEDQRAQVLQAAALMQLSARDQLDALRRLSPEMLRSVVQEYQEVTPAKKNGRV